MNRILRMLDGRYKGANLGSRVQFLDPSGLYAGPAGGKGAVWFVDSTTTAPGDGKSWAHPFLTITDAYAACAAGDTIYISGSFLTEASITCSKAGVSFVGVGNASKQAQWSSATAASIASLVIAASYVRVENIYFKPPTFTSGYACSIKLSGANYARIINNRFQGQSTGNGSYQAIYSPVCDSDNVDIADNEFMYMNTATNGAAILGVEANGLSYSGWRIENNRFNSCRKAIDINGRCCRIMGNTINDGGVLPNGSVGTVMDVMGIDLSGTSSGGNTVTGNTLGGAYTTALYKSGASGDTWYGNWCAATATTAPNGFSILVPAS